MSSSRKHMTIWNASYCRNCPTHRTRVKPAATTSRASALIVAVLVPALALGLYYKLGNWRAQDGTAQPQTADTGMTDGSAPQGEMPPIEDMVKRLEEKLAKDPNSAQGWLMLGRSYVYTNRYTEAVSAYAKAETLTTPPDAQLYAEYAEAMALANRNQLEGAPERLVEKALKLQPDNPNALWLAGMIAFQKADYPAAVKHWEPLQKVTKQDSEQGRVLSDYLAQARAGKPLEPIMPAAAETTPPESTPDTRHRQRRRDTQGACGARSGAGRQGRAGRHRVHFRARRTGPAHAAGDCAQTGQGSARRCDPR